MLRRTGAAIVALFAGCFNPGMGTGGGTTGDGTSSSDATSGASTSSSTGPMLDPTTTTSDPDTTTTDTDTGSTGETTGTDGTTVVPGGICGDGVVDVGEDCDDGNKKPQDGCGEFCQRDALFIFATSTVYAGSFTGLEFADEACEAAAANIAGFPVTRYTAWLSDDVTAAKSRIKEQVLPYIRPGDPLHQVVSNGTVTLTVGSLLAPINRDEHGALVAAAMAGCEVPGAVAWTGTTATGDLAVTCTNWTSPVGMATAGLTTAVDVAWSEGCSTKCVTGARLYCVEDP